MSRIVISGTGLFTPEESISNEELVSSFNSYVDNYNSRHEKEIEAGKLEALEKSSVEFIEKASGIKSRFVMDKAGVLDPDVMCPRIPARSNGDASIQCDMSVAAAREAMQQAGKGPKDIDAVIVACSNMERPYPAMAIEIQNALGIEGFGFDMNVACSTATFGIQTAVDSVFRNSARSVLMVNPEICSGHLNFRDRDSHFIFGDVCTAAIIEKEETCQRKDPFEIIATKLKTRFSNNIRNNFGFLNRADPDCVGTRDKLFVQQGRKVFKEVVPLAAELITGHLAEHQIKPEDIRRIWLHQANMNMNQLICKKIMGKEITHDLAPTILDTYANTASAGSVICFHKHNEDLQEGDIGVICSFGAGYSIGNVIVRKIGL